MCFVEEYDLAERQQTALITSDSTYRHSLPWHLRLLALGARKRTVRIIRIPAVRLIAGSVLLFLQSALLDKIFRSTTPSESPPCAGTTGLRRIRLFPSFARPLVALLLLVLLWFELPLLK